MLKKRKKLKKRIEKRRRLINKVNQLVRTERLRAKIVQVKPISLKKKKKVCPVKFYYSCSIDWFTCNEKIKWRNCEECNNWCCGCIEGRFDAIDEFFCNICLY